MIFYPLSAFINTLTSVAVGIIALTRNPKSHLNRSFVFFAFCVAFWSLCYFLWQTSQDAESALFWSRALMSGAIFIPSSFLHFSMALIGQQKQRARDIMLCYLISILFLFFDFTPFFVKSVEPRLFFRYWPTPGIIFTPFLTYFIVLTVYAHIVMYKTFKQLTGFERNQIKYIFLGTSIGFVGGSTNYLLWYGIPIPPVGNILVSVYVILVAYAIVKYRLMDINLALTRTGLFVLVYSIVLGIPFAVGYITKSWFISTAIAVLCASVGPFVYQYLKRRTDEILLKEQRRYQSILRQLSASMIQIKDMDKLLKLIVYRVARVVSVEFACIYIGDTSENKLLLKFPYTTKGFFPDFPQEMALTCSCELCAYIKKKHRPVFSEELSDEIKKKFRFRSGIIIPSFVRDKLLGFLIMGPKVSGGVYTPDDAIAFEVLANQAALAIENAEFITESQKTQAQLFAAERMSSMGAMAGGMSHQINNRFHAILMATSDTLDSLKFIDMNSCPKEQKDFLACVQHALERIEENAQHGGKIVNDFLNFSQPDRLQKQAKEFTLTEPLARAIEMARIKTSFPEDTIEKYIPENLPLFQGDFVLIQDVLFNTIDNAVDAMKRKEQMIKAKQLPLSPDYKGKIIIRMHSDDSHIQIQIQDNGIGMNDEAKKKLFVPFFTTKATASKGTGLGLFVIEKIISAHKGTIRIDSEYGQGTSFIINLPITQKKKEEA